MARTRNYAEVIRAKLLADPALAKGVEAESFNADLASKVYEARTTAGLTQKQLAHLAGTQQSVISRIEDADYDGHSLSLLRKIASALGLKLRVEFFDRTATKVERYTAGELRLVSSSFPGGASTNVYPRVFISHAQSANVLSQEMTEMAY
jgi:ribosome-binding protein aMBF1 (putative translation factor)